MKKALILLMGLSFVGLVGCNSTGGIQPEKSSVRLNNEELKAFYTDKTHITVHHYCGPGKTYFGSDGSLISKSDSGEVLIGKWWIDSGSNTRCIRWNHANKDFCHYTQRNTDGTHTLVHRKNGKKLVEIKSTVSGNQL